nr:hypothetical protein DA06_29260 [Georgenia sp. SUBG003]
MFGSSRRMDAVDWLSARSWPASASVVAEYVSTSMSSRPYAARVASMLRWMYGCSTLWAFGSTWNRWMTAG